MTSDQPAQKIPRLNYQDGGCQRFQETTRPVMYDGEIVWVVNDFLKVLRFQNTLQSSQYDFRFGEDTYKFMLELRLRGDSGIELWLFSLNESSLTVQYTMKALNASGLVLVTDKPFAAVFDETDVAWGSTKFLSKKQLKADEDDNDDSSDSDFDSDGEIDPYVANRKKNDANSINLPGGSISLCCNFTIFFRTVSDVVQNPVNQLSESGGLVSDSRKLFKTGLLHDFTISCEGEEFKCHRAILASRSKYFESLFTVDMAEKKESCLDIKDANAATLASFLEFVYTDDLSDSSGFKSTELLILADRFQFDQLKLACEGAIAETISISNAVKLLSISHTYSAGHLQKVAATFVRNNRRSLVGSQDWKEMVKTNPEAMEALFID